jgi:hypothetical protein
MGTARCRGRSHYYVVGEEELVSFQSRSPYIWRQLRGGAGTSRTVWHRFVRASVSSDRSAQHWSSADHEDDLEDQFRKSVGFLFEFVGGL